MMAKATRDRPLVLLHKCPNCTTFALGPVTADQYEHQEMASLRRFSRLRLQGAPPAATECDDECSSEDNSVFEEDDEEQQKRKRKTKNAIPKETIPTDSGHSSLDGSPVSRSDSVNSTNDPGANVAKDEGPISDRRSAATDRYRSVSECEGISNSPLKGILKRRSMFGRSLSECIGEEVDIGLGTLYHGDRYNSDSIDEDGESIDGCSDTKNQSSSSTLFKKAVRFNEFVQETRFQSNSSILVQKRKQERKHAKLRRKRTSSVSSIGNEEAINGRTSYGSNTGTEEAISGRRGGIESGGAQPSAQRCNESTRKGKSAPFTDEMRYKLAALESRRRYVGFVIGKHTIGPSSHQKQYRHASNDSALGDDEGRVPQSMQSSGK